MELQLESDLSFSAHRPDGVDFSAEEFTDRVGDGFNEYGVRTNYDNNDLHSVDVIFTAMEPGPPDRRNGVRITADFLRKVGNKSYDSDPPHLLDHRDSETFAKIGDVKDVWFSDRRQRLFLMARVPNTGAPTHTEAVSRYTFDPPSIRDGSVGFGDQYTAIRNDDGEPELTDGKLREFSAVNFPGGYDEGGVAAAFADEAVAAVDVDAQHDGTARFAEHGGDMDVDMDALQEVYDMWENLMNMSEMEMDRWEDHPCSNVGVDDGPDRRTEYMMLSGQPMEEWDKRNMEIANAHIDTIMQLMDRGEPENPESGGRGSCPSRWAVMLLNRGHNPFDGFPSGNPQFDESDATEFDDEGDDAPHDEETSENSAAESFSWETTTTTF